MNRSRRTERRRVLVVLPRHSGRTAGEKSARSELADIFRLYGESYRRHHAALSARPITPAVTATAPSASRWTNAQWLNKQNSELLPTGYFHVVFTLPHELNRLILANRKILLSLLFKAVSETLLEFGRTRLGGTVGIMAVLHTWDQTLKDHFHLHCLVSAGALSFDHSRWISVRKNFLFPVKALSLVFRAKFLDLLKRALDHD